MSNGTYQVKLEIFEGPMDLLIHLIKKNEVDIYDIPIALITDQFLGYIDWLKSMDINFTGDFLLMASTLMKVKSSMLLPRGENEDDEDEDPRLEIIRPLAEYLEIKSAAEQLGKRNILGEYTFVRTPLKEEFPAVSEEKEIKVGLFELIDAFKKILDSASGDHKIDLSADRISVKDRVDEIIEILENKKSIVFNDLFTAGVDKKELIVTFLAILEMVKLGLVQITQHIQSGIIRLFYI